MRSLTLLFTFFVTLTGCGKDGLLPISDNSLGDGSAKSMDVDGDGHNAEPYGDDCDDGDSAIYPGAIERCDMVDNDCDGAIDDKDLNNVGRWWGADYDGDLYVDSLGTVTVCDVHSLDGVAEKLGADPDDLDKWIEVPSYQYGTDGSLVNPDCDDDVATVYPGATETCNGVDDDCDTVVDNGTGSPATWYEDVDGDTYGDAASTTTSCTQPSGYVGNDDDCNDADGDVSPDATEMCDGVDNDCDGSTDGTDAADVTTFYLDRDSDGYGDGLTYDACTAPSGYVAVDGDCDDMDATVNPGAAEVCDSVDNDCNSVVDDGSGSPTMWYRDGDSDGYGDSSRSFSSCTVPSGYGASSGDCDDTDATVNPSATEVFNTIDDDCDGSVDEGVTCASRVSVLNDMGDASTVTAVATDTAFNGNWWDSVTAGSDVVGVAATKTSLGGFYRQYTFDFDMCFAAGVTELRLTGTFATGSLCEPSGMGAIVDAYEDGVALDVTEVSDGSGGCYYAIMK